LATTDDARVHCAVLKIRAVPARAAALAANAPVRGTEIARSLRTQQRTRPGCPATTLPAPEPGPY